MLQKSVAFNKHLMLTLKTEVNTDREKYKGTHVQLNE